MSSHSLQGAWKILSNAWTIISHGVLRAAKNTWRNAERLGKQACEVCRVGETRLVCNFRNTQIPAFVQQTLRFLQSDSVDVTANR